MLVGVNALSVDPGCPGGEDRYLRYVLTTMREIQPGTQFILFTDPMNHASFEGWDRECLDRSPTFGIFGGIDAQLERAARRRGIDVLFTSLWTAPGRISVPTVLYALSLLCFEKEHVREHRRMSLTPKTAKRLCANAAAIVAPSEFIQRKYLELLEIPLNKVIVAPLGVDPVFGQPNACAVQQPFLLTVGATREFRNIPRLREVFGLLKDEFPHNLVVVGYPGEAEPADWGERVMRIEYCATAHLAGLYQHCDVCVQPSLYEGSGVTVLEAMRAGAAVATSRTGGVPEVAGDTPFYFNPENTSSIVAAVRWAIEAEAKQRHDRLKYGKQVAAEFTWEKCAWKTLSAFKRT